MKRVISSFFLFLAVISFGILNVSADSIDSSRPSSITVHYQYDDILLSNTDVSLYFLATIDASGNYQFRDDYLGGSFSPGDMSTSEIALKASEMLSYITSKELKTDFSLKTKEDGTGYFSSLVPGLYLLNIDSQVSGEYRYYANPVLLTIPTLENNTYQYDVTINMKTEREQIEQEIIPPGTTDSGEKVPNTLDNIYLYVGLLVISILVIFGVIIYILKRKGEIKNEKKK